MKNKDAPTFILYNEIIHQPKDTLTLFPIIHELHCHTTIHVVASCIMVIASGMMLYILALSSDYVIIILHEHNETIGAVIQFLFVRANCLIFLMYITCRIARTSFIIKRP